MSASELEELKRWLARRFWSTAGSLIVAAVLHGGAVVWWAASINQRVCNLEQNVERLYAAAAQRGAKP